MEIRLKCHAVNVDPTLMTRYHHLPVQLSALPLISCPLLSPVPTPTHDQQRLARLLVSRLRSAVARVSFVIFIDLNCWTLR